MTKKCFRYINIGGGVGGWHSLQRRSGAKHFFYISDKNGTSKLNKLTIFYQKWNFWNRVAKFDKQPTLSIIIMKQAKVTESCFSFSLVLAIAAATCLTSLFLQSLFSAAAVLKPSSHIINQIHYILSCP